MISKKDIEISKEIVIEGLKEWYKATDEEINQFTKLIENEDPEDWTCGFSDELVPTFEKMRKKLK
jgi:hypothetical protein